MDCISGGVVTRGVTSAGVQILVKKYLEMALLWFNPNFDWVSMHANINALSTGLGKILRDSYKIRGVHLELMQR